MDVKALSPYIVAQMEFTHIMEITLIILAPLIGQLLLPLIVQGAVALGS